MMCGICGMVGQPDAGAVRRMARAMVHRGPDDEAFYEDGGAVLGFRRLSIIDVAGGRQPLSNEDGSIHVVFNGEIYNHRELRDASSSSAATRCARAATARCSRISTRRPATISSTS